MRKMAVVAVCVFASMGGRGASAQPKNADADWMNLQPEVRSAVLQLVGPTRTQDISIDGKTVAALVQSTALQDPAIEAALGVSAEKVRGRLAVGVEVANDRVILVRVALRPGEERLPEDGGARLLAELARRAGEAVAWSSHAAVEPKRQQREQAAATLAAARERQAAAERAYLEAVQANPNWRRGYSMGRPELEQQRQQIERNLAGQRARLEVLTAAETNQPDAAAEQSSPVAMSAAEAAMRLLQQRQARVTVLRQGMEPPAEPTDEMRQSLAAAEDALLEAQVLVQLSSAYRGAMRGGYGGRNELVNLQSSVAEQEAQLAVIDKQLQDLPQHSTLPDAETISRLDQDRQRARQEADRFAQELQRLTANNEGGPVRLVVLDGATGPEAP